MTQPQPVDPPGGVALPPGWTLRSVAETDLSAAVAVIRALDLYLLGSSDASEDELRAHWDGLDLGRDTWLALTPGGEPAGYADYSYRGEHVRLQGDGYVHPGFFGRGVGTALVCAVEARAREDLPLAPAGARVVLHNGVVAADRAARDLLEREGYRAVRFFWRMELALAEPPPEPVWPAGVAVRPAASEADERRLFAATDEAFRDHWGYTPQAFEAWAARKKAGGFDPLLWFLAEEEGEVVGTAVCGSEAGVALVKDLAVRRPWRRRGIGRALLLHALGELRRRGESTVALGVDTDNPTGATALYESVGMRATQAFAVYEKELRPGTPWVEPPD